MFAPMMNDNYIPSLGRVPALIVALASLVETGIAVFLHVAGWLEEARERARQRRALARLDSRLLRDIGIPRHHARREARKPFWRR